MLNRFRMLNRDLKRKWQLYLMLIPGISAALIFMYWPIYGLLVAFQNFNPRLGVSGSPFVGLKWFNVIFSSPDIWQIFYNTFVISTLKIATGLVIPILFALLLNEVRNSSAKRTIQSAVYLPHFFSWVIIGGIVIDIFSLNGVVNTLLNLFGIMDIKFLSSDRYFRFTIILTYIWKEFGWGTIIYLAALTNINPELYESSGLDGANRLQQARYITLPALSSTIVLLAALSLRGILDAGFDQIFVLYNPMVYKTGDILDTYLYRAGLVNAQFSLATALGLIKSLLGLFLMFISYKLASKYADYTIF